MGLEILRNRVTRGIWIFSVSPSKALTLHASTVSHLMSDYRLTENSGRSRRSSK